MPENRDQIDFYAGKCAVQKEPPISANATYGRAELEEILRKMRSASETFYSMAVQTGCHTFIEFTGFMNKYIDVCARSAKEGFDFTLTSIHAGPERLVAEDHDVDYLAEKFACIFAASMFADPSIWQRFKDKIEQELKQP